jgi:hypothetical protein
MHNLLLMILAYLDDGTSKDFFNPMFGINDYGFNVKAGVFQKLARFFIYRLVLGSYFFPVQVLFQVGAAGYYNPVAAPKETAIQADNYRLRILTI